MNLLTLLLCALLPGCGQPPRALPHTLAGFAAPPARAMPAPRLAQGAAPTARWTVMVYMSGDNDLEEYVVKDIENELGLGGSTDQVQVVALADRTPGYDTSRGDWTGTKLFHVTRGLRAEPAAAVADWGERSMGDPATLVDFVSWSKAHYPAEHYALYMWGHGWSWHPGYVMEDKTNHDALDPQEIKSIFPRLGALDLVAYDGCNMAAIEVESLWHGHATALVHSQEYVEWDGIEYDVVLGQLNQNPRMGADQLAIISNRSASLNQEKTGSAVAVDGRFDRLLQAIDHWSLALISGLPRYRAEYARAFAAAQHFFEAPDEKDLYHLASLIRQQVPDPAIQAASQELFTAFGSVMLNEWHSGDYPQAHGITISNPAPEDGEVDSYRSGDFARYTHWDEFLAAYRR